LVSPSREILCFPLFVDDEQYLYSSLKNMAILITGVAGFIGCNLANIFVSQGKRVVGLDNLCRGTLSNIGHLLGNELLSFAKVDLSDLIAYREAIKKEHSIEPITEVWHLAANSDIPAGVFEAEVDLRDTFMTSFNTLEIMKEFKVGVLAFASSSAVYGNLGDAKLVEDIGPMFPISNYGAMKLASEAAISASVESFLNRAFIFRFPNVIGIPATHGVILDFIRKLKATPDNLVVLGDGTQQKSYLHAEDLIDAMLYIREHAKERLNFFNIGAGDVGITVNEIAEQVVKTVAPSASITYGKGNKGWVGDVPKFSYSVDKLQRLGWKPRMNSVEAVRYAVGQIANQEFNR
jgi:UDP-glucose 4-epimerase